MSRLGEVAAGGRRVQDGQLQLLVWPDNEHCARGQRQASLILLVRIKTAIPATQQLGMRREEQHTTGAQLMPSRQGAVRHADQQYPACEFEPYVTSVES